MSTTPLKVVGGAHSRAYKKISSAGVSLWLVLSRLSGKLLRFVLISEPRTPETLNTEQ